MPHICHEGECARSGTSFEKIWGLHQHWNKKHAETVETDPSLGKARDLKRKRDVEDEEGRKRQHPSPAGTGG